MRKAGQRILAFFLAFVLILTGSRITVRAEGEQTGKYVKEVFFAHGRTQKDAVDWLIANGWEPIKGNNDFNAGKDSFFDKSMAVVMGIKRTDQVDEAITDMAVMNMKGGYSFPAYETLLEEKKADIDAFVNSYMPVLTEFRENYNNKGSAAGKKRADIALKILNSFYDGDPQGEYAAADTGMDLGTLLLKQTRQELGEEAYKALSPGEKRKHGDLQQILLESSGSVVILIEQMLALGADPGEQTWLERLAGLSPGELQKNLTKYVPEAAGQDIPDSAVTQFLKMYFGDTARVLAAQWQEIHDDFIWYEEYCEKNGLWQRNKESDTDYGKRVENWFKALEKNNPEQHEADHDRFFSTDLLYACVFETPYQGGWGQTLGDFFLPFDDTNYGRDADNFLPFAAALSEGLRAAADRVSLRMLLLIGTADERGIDYVTPDMNQAHEGDEKVSIYFGVNRGIFRGGVALTNEALMEQNHGHGQAFNALYDNLGVLAVSAYAGALIGTAAVIAGGVMIKKGVTVLVSTGEKASAAYNELRVAQNMVAKTKEYLEQGFAVEGELLEWQEAEAAAQKRLDPYCTTRTTPMGYAGRAVLAIGAVLIAGAAFVKGYQLYRFYQCDFTQIPVMIVDEADIVTYEKDENGKDVKVINFDQYVYYEAAKCNRPAVGELSDWQSGVDRYQEWGCGDVADLNGDFGKEWLALYTVKTLKKGDPILADSLTLQYGSDAMPKNCDQKLHYFSFTNAADLGDMAYSYSNDKDGVYLFWKGDETAAEAAKTASSFTPGQMALCGVGGLVAGILGATLMFRSKKRRKAA